MIDISWQLLLTEAGIFLLLLWLLNTMLFKPLVKHMDDRKKSIKDNMESVNDNSSEATGLLDEAAAIVSAAKKEAHDAREKLIGEARELSESRLTLEREKNEKELEAFFETLGKEREELKNTLLGQAPLFKEAIKAKLASATA